MARRIAILLGHPDPDWRHLDYALAEAYANGAREAGHEVRLIEVARLEFPLVRTKADFDQAPPPAAILEAQRTIAWADHLLVVYPLWLGTMPALLKGFFEQVLRPGFAFTLLDNGRWTKELTGKSARIVVTMGMPAPIYRWYFGAHSLKSLRRNILGFCGIRPIQTTLFGGVETASEQKRKHWLQLMHGLGAGAE